MVCSAGDQTAPSSGLIPFRGFNSKAEGSWAGGVLIPDSFDLDDGPGLSAVLFLRSGKADDEFEFSLLLAEMDVESLRLIIFGGSGASGGLLGSAIMASQSITSFPSSMGTRSGMHSGTDATASEEAPEAAAPFSALTLLSLLSSDEASLPESIETVLRILSGCPSASSPSLAAWAANFSNNPSLNLREIIICQFKKEI